MFTENNRIHRIGMVVALLLAMSWGTVAARGNEADCIQPYAENPYYWQYKGKPVLLLGGSDQDNLFNHPTGLQPGDALEAHLDLLVSVGGNYIRNTMSTRDPGNIFPFYRDPDTGLFDLDSSHDAYWKRLDALLALAKDRNIIVQIELWDPHDYYQDSGDHGGWSRNPFNPANNVNYTVKESGLIETVDWSAVHDPEKDHPFFQTAPAERDMVLVRRYQERFVDKVLDVAFPYPNVLYCVSNESNDSLHWSDYWAAHLRRRSDEAGYPIQVGEMRFPNNPRHGDFQHIIERPELYAFLDIGQLNRPVQQRHWDNLQYLRGRLAERPRPINNTKIYGGDAVGWTGGYRTGEECFWRNVLGGAASARFHRPPAGRGLSVEAQSTIRSARMLTDAMNVFACEPQSDLLSERSANEAYCLAEPGWQYAVYFPDGGTVKLDVSEAKGTLQVHWLDIDRSAWRKPQSASGGGTLELRTPGKGHWAVLLRSTPVRKTAAVAERVRPWPDNPHYLAWGDTPIFPLGAAGYHSWTPISRPGTVDFEEQLDRLAGVMEEIGSAHVCGFVRCLPYDPMNHMHDGEVKEVLQPWVKLPDGRYDLERFEPKWQKRLQAFLTAALRRRIVVSLEIWDDWSVTRGPGGAYDPGAGAAWNAHPFNPRNNVNYDESVLPAATSRCDAPFYNTIPSRAHIRPVLDLQKRYVDHLLAIASEYPNILISIANESRAHLEWSGFWAEYVRQRVPADMMIGEMPSTNRKDGGGECEQAFSPLALCTDRRYDYVDVAQGVSGHEFGSSREQALGGGRRLLEYRRSMAEAGARRPLVVSKDYTRGPDGGDMVLWGRFVGGAAAARFHRLAGNHPESVRRFQHEAVGRLGRSIAQVPFWRMNPEPDIVTKLPAGAGVNVLAERGGPCVIQLIGGAAGETLHVNLPPGKWVVRWIDPATGRELIRSEETSDATGLELEIPGECEHRIAGLRLCNVSQHRADSVPNGT